MQNSVVTQVKPAQEAMKLIVNNSQPDLPASLRATAQMRTHTCARAAARWAQGALNNTPKAMFKTMFKTMSKAAFQATLKATFLGAALAGCTSGPVGKPLPYYRCEYGIEFTAKFVDDSVAVESTRGYDVLYRGGKYASTPANAKPNSSEYSNARMQIEFNLGVTQREAIVRYPLLPLVSRCVRDN